MAPTSVQTDNPTLVSAPEQGGESAELQAASRLILRTRELYEQLARAVRQPETVHGDDWALVPFRLADMVVAIEAAELAFSEARYRRHEGSATAGALVCGAIGLILEAAELVRCGAEQLHHGQDAISLAVIAEFNDVRHATLAVTGTPDAIRLGVSTRL